MMSSLWLVEWPKLGSMQRHQLEELAVVVLPEPVGLVAKVEQLAL
jgi:hypothetical protein